MATENDRPVKKVGRPAKNAELGKRVNVMFRLNEVRRDQIMSKAEANGRSMSEEIEVRLDKSLRDDTRMFALLNLVGGRDLLMFCSFISGDLGVAIREADTKFGNRNDWFNDEEKLNFVREHMKERVSQTVLAFAGTCVTGVAQKMANHVLNQE